MLNSDTDNLEYLFYNKFNKSIYFYDFRKEKLKRQIYLTYEKGKFPSINAFYYLNQDSILLFPEYGDFYYVCDRNGKISSEKLSFVDQDDKDKIESHWITSSNPIVRLENNIYINNVFGWIAKEGEPDKFLLIEHDIYNRSSNFILQHPPSIYDKNFDSSTFRHLVFTSRNRLPLYCTALTLILMSMSINQDQII